MNYFKTFSPLKAKVVLVSKIFSDFLISNHLSLLEQRMVIVILSSLHDDQQLFINKKKSLSKPLSFESYIAGWTNQNHVTFKIPFKDFKIENKIKNSVIQDSLNKLTDKNWLKLQDESCHYSISCPLIYELEWDKKNITFKMDKIILKHLFNMSPFYQIKKNLPFNSSCFHTIRFLLWLSKFKKMGFAKKNYSQLLAELSIRKDKYEGIYRFDRDFLIKVKADLDAYNDLSFTYIFEDEEINFTLIKTNPSAEEKFELKNKIQIDRSLIYLKEKRKLNESNLNVLRQLYNVEGHKSVATITNRKIDALLQGDDYIKTIFRLVNQVENNVSVKRDNVSVKKDIVSVKRDIVSVKRDIVSVKCENNTS